VVDVLLILDGASEPLGPEPTSLERARTPLLDELARAGELTRLRTVPAGLPAGSETAVPVLLGWTPPAPVDRGALEAAARGIETGPGERARRVDCPRGDHAPRAAAQLARLLPQHRVLRIGGHRLLAVGPAPLPALPARLRAWPGGVVPPPVLDESTVVVAAAGAVAGLARLMGARVVVPPGATGGPDTDLFSKAGAARAAASNGAERVVVHVGAPDEAAHARDRGAKVAAIERVDRELLPALAELADSLTVCPDHGCDPATGEHDAHPVPALRWEDPAEHGARAAPAPRGERGSGEHASGARLTERAVAQLPVLEPAPAAVVA
jgi:2,3-bisphosphoglycerate-independent phosphoglycerate mutase